MGKFEIGNCEKLRGGKIKKKKKKGRKYVLTSTKGQNYQNLKSIDSSKIHFKLPMGHRQSNEL